MYLLNSLAIAISMYSKIPVPNVEWNEKNMKYAMCFFPVVGAVIGIIQFLIGGFLLQYTDCGSLFFAVVSLQGGSIWTDTRIPQMPSAPTGKRKRSWRS